jgi:AcrR family transcriptional regulator
MKSASRTRPRATRAEPRADGGRAYRGLSPEARKAERRERLVAAGVEVFGTVGFQAATVRQLCAAAGLTERYFYESFDNQAGLFAATYDHAVDRLRATLMQAVVTAPSGFAALAESVLRAFYGELQRDPRTARIMLIEIYGVAFDRGRLYQRGVVDFAALVRALIDAHVRVDRAGLDADLLATAVVGACIHLATHWLIGGFREPLDTMVANSLAIVLAIGRQLGPQPT